MIVDIRKMGDPCLLQKSVQVLDNEFNTPELDALIQDLIDTKNHLGGVGIAAPQIGVNKQVVVIEYYQANITRYSDIGDCPLAVIINPEIIPIGSDESSFNEGCLSLPGLRGLVTRPKSIRYKYYDQTGELHAGEDSGFFATAMQHEYDHLMGILYPMRMKDISKLAFLNQ